MEGRLEVKVFETRKEMGEAAAQFVAEKINELLADKNEVNMIFAAAPSQNELIESLLEKEIEWQRINAFHMDEYMGLPDDAPQRFGNFLEEKVFNRVPFKSIHYLNGNATNPEDECERYAQLLQTFPTDIVCMGIGENGHIAFNDPPVADFNDLKLVKIVELDHECRQQQVNDGCFINLDLVPKQALTLTVPALMKGKYIFCVVPGELKANAVYNTLKQEQSEKYPSTILRSHSNAIMLLDKKSSSKLYE